MPGDEQFGRTPPHLVDYSDSEEEGDENQPTTSQQPGGGAVPITWCGMHLEIPVITLD